MIEFACKKFDLNEVIRCGLNLTKIEFKIMEYFIKKSPKKFTALEISKIFKIGLSTSQKAIKKIYFKGILNKNQKNLEKGGYIFVYFIKEKKLLKNKILEIIDNWTRNIKKRIKNW